MKKVLPTCTKWKDILLDVNAIGEKAGLEPISLSKLSAIKKANLSKYIIEVEATNLPGAPIARS